MFYVSFSITVEGWVRLTSRINVQTWRISTSKTVAQKRRTLSVRERSPTTTNRFKTFSNWKAANPCQGCSGPFDLTVSRGGQSKRSLIRCDRLNCNKPSFRVCAGVKEVVYSLHVLLWFVFLSPNHNFLYFYPLVLRVPTRQWLKCRPQLLLCSLSGLCICHVTLYGVGEQH